MNSKKARMNPGLPVGTSGGASLASTQFQQALQMHKEGRLAQAKLLCENLLRAQPGHVNGLHLLGLIAVQHGNFQSAVTAFEKATQLAPQDAALRCNQGNALAALHRYEEAVANYSHAIAIQAGFVDALNGRAIALLKLGKFDQAYGDFGTIMSIQPDLVQAKIGQEISLRCYAKTLEEQGQPAQALFYYTKALMLHETIEAKLGFANCAKNLSLTVVDDDCHKLLVRSIKEAWTRPVDVGVAAMSVALLSQDVRECFARSAMAWPDQLSFDELFGGTGLKAVTDEPLISCVLEHMPASSVEFERFLTQARRVLLDFVVNTEMDGNQEPVQNSDVHRQTLSLLRSIARQCYINEYVFFASEDELAQAAMLQDKLNERLQRNGSVPDIWLAAVGAYTSLDKLEAHNEMANRGWEENTLALVKLQILDPAKELEIRTTISKLTPVEDSISLAVQSQYEENPYPRWIHTPTTIQSLRINDYFRQHFPKSSFQPLAKQGELDVLIAGCGTGQQSIETLQSFQNARVLAIDLSLSSISYAKRKTLELGLQNIEYGQADILQLGTIDRTFDVIESVGVLHHMADPLAAWEILTKILRPGGFMRLGFYSESARQCVVAGRQYIVKGGYQPTAADIRRCRQDMMAKDVKVQFETIFSFEDFFSMSDCRDLLFHVQEIRFTIPQLKEAMQELGLNFIGFSVAQSVANDYLEMFPGDSAKSNLDNWHLFERRYPNTFAGMYQFWTQKV